MSLRSIANDGNFLVLDHADVGITVIIYAHNSSLFLKF
jgi:hypothetical protein